MLWHLLLFYKILYFLIVLYSELGVKAQRNYTILNLILSWFVTQSAPTKQSCVRTDYERQVDVPTVF